MPFSIVQNQISQMDADAVVEYSRWDGSGEEPPVSFQRDGSGKARFCISLPPCSPELPDPCAKLRKIYKQALLAAADAECRSIAFPVLEQTDYGYPREACMQAATEVFADFLKSHELEIVLAVPERTSDKVSGMLFQEVRAYLDEKEAAGGAFVWAVQPELPQPGMPQLSMPQPGMPQPSMPMPGMPQPSMPMPGMPQPSMPMPSKPSMRRQKRGLAAPKARFRTHAADGETGASVLAEPGPDFGSADAGASLESRLKSMYTDTFEKHMQQLINKKGMKNSEVYAAANISKQYFSKLMKGQVKPSKEKVLAIAVGLRLNLDETVDFLRLAGYALSPVSQTDVVVEYFIRKKDYNVMKIDIVLFDYGLPTLSDAKSTAS